MKIVEVQWLRGRLRMINRNVRGTVRACWIYGRNPRRIGEAWRWWCNRHSSTMELRLPWWPYAAISAVEARLQPQARVFEFGGGGSTLWLIDRGAEVTVTEHDVHWSRILDEEVGEKAEIVLRAPSQSGTLQSSVVPGLYFDAYATTVEKVPDGSLDLVIVDGRARVACALLAINKVTPGGMLLLDDSDRKRYSSLTNALRRWDRKDFVGLKPGGGPPCQTSVWVKPA